MASKSAAVFGGLLGVFLSFEAGFSFAQQPPAASPAPAAVESIGAPSLDAYRDSLRRLFVLREYDKLLTLADEIERNYPAEQTVAYYRNESNRRIEEKKREAARPYKSMRDRGVVLETPPPTPIPVVTPPPSPETPANIAPQPAPAGAQPGESPEATPVAAAARPEPSPAPAAPSSLSTDSIKDLAPWIGGAGAVVLALVALVLMRRRGAAAEAEVEAAPKAEPKSALRSFPASSGAVARAPLGGAPAFDDEGETSFDKLDPIDDVKSERDLFAESTGGFSPASVQESAPPPHAPIRDLDNEPDDSPISISSVSGPPAPKLDAADQRTEFPSLPDVGDETNPFDLQAPKTESRPPWESKSATDTDIPMVSDEPEIETPITLPPPPDDSPISPAEMGLGAAVFGAAAAAASAPPSPDESTSVAEGGLADIDSPEGEATDAGLETATAPGARGGLTIADRDTLFELPDDHDPSSKTQTSWNLSADSEGVSPAAASAAEPVKTFHRDETIQLAPGDLGESGDSQITEPPMASPMIDTKTSPGIGGPSDTGSADPFEKEKYHGMLAFKEARWDQAVHHLSVAAALRPEAADVKDFLRRARKMRKTPEGA